MTKAFLGCIFFLTGVVSWKLIFRLTLRQVSLSRPLMLLIWLPSGIAWTVIIGSRFGWQNQEFFDALSLLIKLSGLWQRAINIHTSHVSTFVAFEDP